MSLKEDQDFKGFILNFLAVVLGIALTFTVESILTTRKETSDVKASLILVKNELEDNISYIEFGDSMLVQYAQAAAFLIRYEGRYEEAPADSMLMYSNTPLTIIDLNSSEEAFELLKSSSLFTKIRDLDLALEIIHTYGAIRDEIATIKMIFEIKGKYFDEAMQRDVKVVLSQNDLTAVKLWNSITSTVEGRQYLRELIRIQRYHDSAPTIDVIRQTINQIDEYK